MAQTAIQEEEGSWTPFIILTIILLLRWLAFSNGDVPVKFRRWYSMQKVQWKKQLGYRDESKYKMGAGDGANQRHKRQG